jgi:hypothetical protein
VAGFWSRVFVAEGFFSVPVFPEFEAPDFAIAPVEGDEAAVCAVGVEGAVAEAEGEGSARRPRIFGRAMMATMINTTAKTGTT